MKHKPHLFRPAQRRAIALPLAFTLALAGAAQAQSTWLPTASGTQLWATASNWDPASVPSAAGAVVNFTADLAGGQSITMGTTRTVGTLNLGLSGNKYRYNFNNTAWILKANAGDTLGTATINVNNDVSSGDEHILQGTIQMQVENVNLNINSAGGELMFSRNFTDNDGDGTRSPTMTLSAVAGASVFEFRNITTTTSRNQWGKLVVNQHAIFRNRDAEDAGGGTATDRSLGIVLSSYLADAITLNGGTLQTGLNLNYNISTNRGITLGALGGTLDANGASKAWTVDSIITGAGGLTLSGDGTTTLNAVNDYTGATTVAGGKLIINGNISTSSLTTVGVGATLAGNGTVGNTIVNGTLAPGASPGTLTQDGGSMQLGVGGNYNWEIHDATGVAGTGYDTTNLINGAALDLSLLSAGNTYNINLWSLSEIGPDVNGDAINFNNALAYSWTLFSTGETISGFSTDKFTINIGAFNGTSGFSNALGGGVFSVGLADSDTDLVLNFTPIPEPRAALLGGLGLLALLRRRR